MTGFVDGVRGIFSVTSGAERFRLSEDLPLWAQLSVVALLVATVILLFLESRANERARVWLFVTGMVSALLLGLAVLRPTQLTTRGTEVPGLAVALVDASHRLNLPGDESGRTRAQEAERVLSELDGTWEKARLTPRYFSGGLVDRQKGRADAGEASDLLQSLRQIANGEGERPRSIVVLSDGRLTRPGEPNAEEWEATVKQAAGGIPVHTVALAQEVPGDRSIRKVGFTGSAVAHQPLTLKLEIGCEPADSCDQVEVVVREHLEGQDPVELVRGETKGEDGLAELDLEVTLDRAGGRVVEIELQSDKPDDIPDNDRRVLPVQVRRDRLRMLHVAGRPTYDVRALRMFLKSDESIDLISFFILRTMTDQVSANQDELALIPFPVDELFSEHLKSFDAVILQDIDAPKYGLNRYFPSMKSYVTEGGGLILVGGPTGFASGGYAGSEVGDVLPVELPLTGEVVTNRPFVPAYTSAGRAAPLLRSLRSTLGEELPEMSGANFLGRPRPGSLVLWAHPSLPTPGQSGGDPMPVLALGEVGDGRTIAISVDSTHQLRFGAVGAATGGRAYADLWSGLLGWLMRDPRYEGAQIRLETECIAMRDQVISVEPPPPAGTDVKVTLEKLGSATSEPRVLEGIEPGADGALRYVARGLLAGGYAARVQVGEAPPTRAVFACEAGGQAWSDSRPDAPRLSAISRATGGTAVGASEIDQLPEPESTFVAARRESSPILPSWVWAMVAALFMSAHWVLRRSVGVV